MFAIRREHRDLLNCDRWMNELIALESDPAAPLVPYARVRRGRRRSSWQAMTPTPRSSQDRRRSALLGFDEAAALRIDDLWNEDTRTMSGADLAAGFEITVGADNTAAGGVAILAVTSG